MLSLRVCIMPYFELLLLILLLLLYWDTGTTSHRSLRGLSSLWFVVDNTVFSGLAADLLEPWGVSQGRRRFKLKVGLSNVDQQLWWSLLYWVIGASRHRHRRHIKTLVLLPRVTILLNECWLLPVLEVGLIGVNGICWLVMLLVVSHSIVCLTVLKQWWCTSIRVQKSIALSSCLIIIGTWIIISFELFAWQRWEFKQPLLSSGIIHLLIRLYVATFICPFLSNWCWRPLIYAVFRAGSISPSIGIVSSWSLWLPHILLLQVFLCCGRCREWAGIQMVSLMLENHIVVSLGYRQLYICGLVQPDWALYIPFAHPFLLLYV